MGHLLAQRAFVILGVLFAVMGIPVGLHEISRRRRSIRSTLGVRYLTLAVLSVVVLGAGYLGGVWVVLGATLLAFQGSRELWPVLAAAGLPSPRGLATCVTTSLPVAAAFGVTPLFGTFMVGVVLLSLGILKRGPDAAAAFAGSLLGAVFVGLSSGCLVLLREAGPITFLFVIVTVQFADIGAMLGGMLVGRRKLAPGVSPGKTMEGLTVGTIAAVIASIVIVPAPSLPLPLSGGLAVMLAMSGLVGDLLASAIKRAGGVKDFGTLLPGHGGVLDRFDSYLVAAPVAWVVFSVSRVVFPR